MSRHLPVSLQIGGTLGGALDKAFGVDAADSGDGSAAIDSLLDDALAARTVGDRVGYEAILRELDSAIRDSERPASSMGAH